MKALAIREVDARDLAELRALAEEEARLKTAVDSDMHAATAHIAWVKSTFGELMEEIEALNNELNPPKPKEPTREPPPMDGVIKRIHERQAELKALYKRLRQRCHPDKTDDTDLNETYHLAEEAYERGDIDAMRALSRSIGASRSHGRGTSRADRVRAKLILVRERVIELRGTLGSVRGSVAYQELEGWRAAVKRFGKVKAEELYKRKLTEVISAQKQQLAVRKHRTTTQTTTFTTWSR